MLGIFSYIMSRIGAIVMTGMMGLTVCDVLGRYLFNKPVLGSFEMTQFMVLVVVFSFLGYTQSQGGHVNVDLLVDQFPGPIQRIIDLFNHLVCLVFFILVSYKAYHKIIDFYESGEKPLNLSVPNWPFAIFLMLGCMVLCVEYLRNLIKLFIRNRKDGDN